LLENRCLPGEIQERIDWALVSPARHLPTGPWLLCLGRKAEGSDCSMMARNRDADIR